MRAIWLSIPLAMQAPAPVVEETDAKTFAEARTEAVAELVTSLESLAEWCQGQKLFAERDKAWLAVLVVSPEHAGAHKGLGHHREKDGTWRVDEARKPPKNRGQGTAEAEKRRAEALAAHGGAVLALLEKHAQELGTEGREKVLDELLALDPDDAAVHELRGEVRLEDRWVLRETVRAKQRRPEIKAFVDEGEAKAPAPERTQPDAHEAGLGVAWKQAFATPLVRVVATGDEQEALNAARSVYAAGELFRRSFGAEPKYPEHLRIMLLADPAEKAALLERHPGVGAESRGYLQQVLGAGVPFTGDFFHSHETPEGRRDGIVRILLGWLFLEGYGISTEHGWIHEGFGLYMTRELVGTRLNWFTQPSRYADANQDAAFRARLYDSSTNWVNEAYEMLKREKRPALASLLGKNVNDLTAEELLVAYVMAAYLLEGRPDETPELLRRIGAGENQRDVLKAVLGLDPVALEARIVRWLSERR